MAITGWGNFRPLSGGDGPLRPGKGRELSGGNYRSAGAELDAALAAVAWATEDEG
jgi:hypothetical protein